MFEEEDDIIFDSSPWTLLTASAVSMSFALDKLVADWEMNNFGKIFDLVEENKETGEPVATEVDDPIINEILAALEHIGAALQMQEEKESR